MRTPTRLLVAAVVVCVVLSSTLVPVVTSSGAPTVRIDQTQAHAFSPDVDKDGRISWYDALCALMCWIVHTGDIEIP